MACCIIAGVFIGLLFKVAGPVLRMFGPTKTADPLNWVLVTGDEGNSL